MQGEQARCAGRTDVGVIRLKPNVAELAALAGFFDGPGHAEDRLFQFGGGGRESGPMRLCKPAITLQKMCRMQWFVLHGCSLKKNSNDHPRLLQTAVGRRFGGLIRKNMAGKWVNRPSAAVRIGGFAVSAKIAVPLSGQKANTTSASATNRQ